MIPSVYTVLIWTLDRYCTVFLRVMSIFDVFSSVQVIPDTLIGQIIHLSVLYVTVEDHIESASLTTRIRSPSIRLSRTITYRHAELSLFRKLYTDHKCQIKTFSVFGEFYHRTRHDKHVPEGPLSLLKMQ
jgi:hypothetical protein